jgi:hypothetical protein
MAGLVPAIAVFLSPANDLAPKRKKGYPLADSPSIVEP